MNQIDSTEKNVNETTAGEKKTWVTPAATIEQVSDVTQITPSGTTDGATCHT